jgi:hypothetical protein
MIIPDQDKDVSLLKPPTASPVRMTLPALSAKT